MKLLVKLILLLTLSMPAYPQVVNDSVHRRVELEMGIPYNSYTARSTVERNCVDESLTGKCIKYHNDQWFFFRSDNRSKLFVNVAHQQCKDLNGVQLVLLSGEPCNPRTYHILSCVSSGTNDDFYVEANVIPHTTYLLAVDGYLEDFCEFDITLDSIPRGLPSEPNLDIPGQGEIVGKVVDLRWILPDSLPVSIDRFIVYRRDYSSYRFTGQDTIPVERNAFGEIQEHYRYTDTLPDYQVYFYRIAAQDYTHQQHLLAEYSFRRRETRKTVSVPLHYRNNTPLTITIWNSSQDKVLERRTLTYQKESPRVRFDLTQYWENGQSEVVIEVTDNKKNRTETTVVNLAKVGYPN